MRILILTQYFPPETGAPQNRLHELAVRLRAKGATVDVLTAFPNYPQNRLYDGYRNMMYKRDELDGLAVHRSYIWVNQSKSVLSRLLTYFSFVFSSLIVGVTKLEAPDYVLCESPPLFLGITGYLLCRIKTAKLIFNVSDLWPESAAKLGLVTNPVMLGMATWLEEFLYRASHLITGQTNGIVDDIRRRVRGKTIHWLPNGTDLSFYDARKYDCHWRSKHGFSAKDILFLYAGLMGHAQGLDVIIKAAAKLRADTDVKFILLGTGPLREDLLSLKNELKVENVFFFEPVSKAEMPFVLKSVDVGIVPLRKLDLFLGAIPSKIFELLAMRRPILLGVDGEAKRLFIDEGRCGAFFEPENPDDLAAQIRTLVTDPEERRRMGERGWSYVNTRFNRDKIVDEFWARLGETHAAS